jgi:hypothetical protein
MKLKINKVRMLTLILLLMISCGGSNSEKNAASTAIAENASASLSSAQQDGVVGEWEQQYTCFDKNNNNKLEPEEKKPSNTRVGFDWFRFNADGSCLRDKDVKFKGTYEIQEKNGNKKLVIQGGDNLRYTIHELTDKELILGSDGGFIVFKKIK